VLTAGEFLEKERARFAIPASFTQRSIEGVDENNSAHPWDKFLRKVRRTGGGEGWGGGGGGQPSITRRAASRSLRLPSTND
jgi:hypothetical protein